MIPTFESVDDILRGVSLKSAEINDADANSNCWARASSDLPNESDWLNCGRAFSSFVLSQRKVSSLIKRTTRFKRVFAKSRKFGK